MKIIIFLVTLCLTFSTFASSGSLQGLVNDYRYFLEVEWDQKDMALLRSHEKMFQEQLSLISPDELENYVKENVRPEEYELMKMRLKSGQDPMTVLRELSQENEGASWSAAGMTVMVVGGITLTLFVAYTWFIHNQLECDGFYDCHGGE
jgi:hypothetical protein